jgi:diguanylate cyclase
MTTTGQGLEQDIWERKYHLALERMERDEQDSRELEAGLRRLGLRLTTLARGQGSSLDALLDRLNEQLKSTPALTVLEGLLAELSDAVSLSVPDVAPVAENPLPEKPVAENVDALRADIARLQGLLAAVSTRLGDMTRYLAAELEHTDSTEGDSRTLDATVREEMRLLGEKTRAATDLGDLQAEVDARLTFIDRHFREYREREDARLASYRDNADRMRSRVTELETQATSLQDSLRREHALALTDQLTELPNRLAYERHVADVEESVRHAGAMACVGAFDIDHFKVINDSFGHAAGDAVLRIVGKTLAKALDGRAFVARYGGEEFVVVFEGCTPDEALAMSQALCDTVASLAFHASSKPVRVTMSGGISCFHVADNAASVFDRADRALYAAKRAGRNRCQLG